MTDKNDCEKEGCVCDGEGCGCAILKEHNCDDCEKSDTCDHKKE